MFHLLSLRFHEHCWKLFRLVAPSAQDIQLCMYVCSLGEFPLIHRAARTSRQQCDLGGAMNPPELMDSSTLERRCASATPSQTNSAPPSHRERVILSATSTWAAEEATRDGGRGQQQQDVRKSIYITSRFTKVCLWVWA